jgi:hypothetical protein
MTTEQIISIYKNFNHLYFNNELPLPNEVQFKCAKKFLGQFSWDGAYKKGGTCTLRMSTAYHLTDLEIEKVIIHEMIHVWQWVHDYRDAHGRTFKLKASIINNKTNYKYSIARCTKLENPVSIKDENKCYKGLIMTYNDTRHPGKSMVALCTEKSIEYFRTWFTTKSEIYNVKYYKVSSDYYNDKRKSIKVVSGYPYTDKEFEENIIPTIISEVKPRTYIKKYNFSKMAI